MNKKILAYIELCEGFKVAIKNLHWSADNLSQHKLCDDIADAISEFEDLVSEVEQSISGKIKLNGFTPKEYKINSLKTFVEDVIYSSKKFLKELEGMGEDYIGIKAECEAFIGTMQRNLYLVNFTLKEQLKKRLKDSINESRPKNLATADEIEGFLGRTPKHMSSRINRIYKLVNDVYGIDKKKYSDEAWEAVDLYRKALDSFGWVSDVEIYPCANPDKPDWDIRGDGGYCDYDPSDHMPRSKQYKVNITCVDGMAIGGYIKCMAAGTVSDPFSSYDTCMVLWPKSNKVLEGNESMKKQLKLTESELRQVVKEAAMKILSETPLNYDIDNFSGRHSKTEPSDEEWALADSAANGDYLDNPFNQPNSWDDDEWIDGDKDMENEYSWDRFDEKPIAQGIDDYYKVGKSAVPREVDDAISSRNRANDWSERELRNRDRMMDKWVNGKRDVDDIGDAWDDIHYESKKPMKTINEVGDTYGDNKSGAYKIGKLAARQDWRDKEPQKSAKTLSFALKSSPEDSDGFDKWSKTVKAGYSDGKQQFKVTEAELKQIVKEAAMKVLEGIDIDPKNKGKFTATKERTGKTTEELKHSKNPLTRKRATFAANVKKWAKNRKK